MTLISKCICGHSLSCCDPGIEQCRNKMPDYSFKKTVMTPQIQAKIDEIEELLGFTSYDIDPIGPRTDEMLRCIQKEVKGDIESLQKLINELKVLLKESQL